MKASKRTVNFCMRSRSSSKPKLMLGSVSATEVPTMGGFDDRLEDIEGSNADAILADISIFVSRCGGTKVQV